jgi:hexosaminidase
MNGHLLLIPVPRRLFIDRGELTLSGKEKILIIHDDPTELLFSVQRLEKALQTIGNPGAGSPTFQNGGAEAACVTLRVNREVELSKQGYQVVITEQGVTITATHVIGIFYGVCTLVQILAQCSGVLPCLQIEDWPDFPVRGVMIDISRNRVPTMETLFNLVDKLAGWKINQLQLYTEHTFAYSKHREVWSESSPMTAEEILLLDTYCRERFIDLVPNQQSFGHMERWLNLPNYKYLAEVDEGFQTPWEYCKGSFSLCPTNPASIEFLRGLYGELLPNFSSKMFNVGCDETWDLGQGGSMDACDRLGKGQVYFDFLLQIFQEVRRFGKTPQFWGDIIIKYPELVAQLPKDIIALEWGYEADHPYDEHAARYASLQVPFYVCPGTSSWCSISGRTDNAVANLKNAAENGLKHGASGYLITDWGDHGHWQTWPVSYLGFMTGSAYAWCLESSREMDIPKMLSWQAFGDGTGSIGRAVYDLGNLYQQVGFSPINSSLLFSFMRWPLEKTRAYQGLSKGKIKEALESINTDWNIAALGRIGCPDADLTRLELHVTTLMLRHACNRALLALEDDHYARVYCRQQLKAELSALVEEFRGVWLARNRTGGLADSIRRLEKLYSEYAGLGTGVELAHN